LRCSALMPMPSVRSTDISKNYFLPQYNPDSWA
jgi:hypothetical protein